MYAEFDNGYWNNYRHDKANPNMEHLTYCKGMIEALKSLTIWGTIEVDLPMHSQVRDANGYLCDRDFVCGLSEDEWEYVGNLLVTLPNYPTPLFFFCAYPILSPLPAGGGATTTRSYITDKPLVFVSFGLNNFEQYALFHSNFSIYDHSIIFDYDPNSSHTYNAGDIVTFDDTLFMCLTNNCNVSPWASRTDWMPQMEELTNIERRGKKIYTAGMTFPKYFKSDKNGIYYYNKSKKITNWTLGKHDKVYQWRVADIPYATGSIVEYNGLRYKNVSTNIGGCCCTPMPYNFVPPQGCSGHWLPEFFDDFPLDIQSPILPIFSSEGRVYNNGKRAEDFLVSYHNDTLTFIDCTRINIVERGWKNAHLINEAYPGKGDGWVSISPCPNNLDTDTICDYFVFGGTWALGSSRFHFTVSRDSNCDDISTRAHHVGTDCPKSSIIYNEAGFGHGNSDVLVNSDLPSAKFSDLTLCGIINAVVDSKDGTSQLDIYSSNGISFYSDYPMRLTFTTDLRRLNPKGSLHPLDKNYTAYSFDTSPCITVETNYNRVIDPSLNLITYSPFYVPDKHKSTQAMVHVHSALQNQLNGLNYFAPIWMYVKREPVLLQSWSVMFKSNVLFATDTVYSGYKEKIVVDNKTYLVFKYLISRTSGNEGRCGVAILVDERGY